MKQLTNNAIKTIVEKKEQAGDGLLVQIVHLTEFTEENKKKNMKAKIILSDGVSKITGFITDQGWSQLVSTQIITLTQKFNVTNFDVISINMAKGQQLQFIVDKP